MRKTVLGALTLLLLSFPVSAVADTNFELFGSSWNTTDVDNTFGGGLALGIPLGNNGLGVKLRGTYYQELNDEPVEALFDDDEGFFQEESLEVLPFDAGLSYQFGREDAWARPWIAAGPTYFMLDSTRSGINVDDETGFHASVGSSFGNPSGFNFFAEALYRSTEATVRRDREPGVDDINIQDEVALDLDGISLNAGLVWRF